MYKISKVRRVDVAGQLGTAFGFDIATANGQAVANFAYRTEAEAKEAAEHVGSALGKAIRVLAYP